MKIIVGGGSGYIGAVLVPYLINNGHYVKVIDNLWFGNNLPETVELEKKNLKDVRKEDMSGFDQFIFLAGVSNDPMAEYSPYINFNQNVALPMYLAYTAKKTGIKRFIFASSGSVYGYTDDQELTEEDEVNCEYPYGLSKRIAEKGLMALQDDNFSVICIRKGTVCGYGPRIRFDLVINTMFKCAMTNKKITVNNPYLNRPILSINDAALGYLKAVECDRHINGIFNLATNNYSIGDLGRIVRDQLEKLSGEKITLEILEIPDMRNYKMALTKAKNILRFEPKDTIENIVQELYDHREEFGDYNDDKFYNIRTFKKLKDIE